MLRSGKRITLALSAVAIVALMAMASGPSSDAQETASNQARVDWYAKIKAIPLGPH